GDLDVDIKLRGAVLQRLKFADRLAELLALLEVIDGAAEYLLAQPDHFGGHGAAADIEHALQQLITLIDFAEHAVGVDLDIVERNPRRVVRIDHHRAFGVNALALGIDEEQRQSVAFAGRARAARRHDQKIGGVPIDHKGLVADKPKTVA